MDGLLCFLDLASVLFLRTALILSCLLLPDSLLLFEFFAFIISLFLSEGFLLLLGDSILFHLELLLLLFENLSLTFISLQFLLPLLFCDVTALLLELGFAFNASLLRCQLLLHLLQVFLLLKVGSFKLGLILFLHLIEGLQLSFFS